VIFSPVTNDGDVFVKTKVRRTATARRPSGAITGPGVTSLKAMTWLRRGDGWSAFQP
jgi:hypothetical protein